MLGDFGFIRVTTISAKISNEGEAAAAFMAPELLSTRFGLDKPVPSKEADVFALGMTIYQVLTGKRPFSQISEGWIIHTMISGERPPEPEDTEQIGMTGTVWTLLTECWDEDRAKRPNISDILKRFCDITGERKTTASQFEMVGPRQDTIDDHGSIYSERIPVQCE